MRLNDYSNRNGVNMKKINVHFFTVIELIVSSTLMLVIFLLIGFVFNTVATSAVKFKDNLTDADRASVFFTILARDVEAGYPLFYLGLGDSGKCVNMSSSFSGDPTVKLTGDFASTDAISTGSNNLDISNSPNEFFHCVTTVVNNGGVQTWDGGEKVVNWNIDYSDKPVRYASYGFTGKGSSFSKEHGLIEHVIYRRSFILRSDARKFEKTAGYTVKNVEVNRDKKEYQGDVKRRILLKNVYSITVDVIEKNDSSGFPRLILDVELTFGKWDDKHINFSKNPESVYRTKLIASRSSENRQQ